MTTTTSPATSRLRRRRDDELTGTDHDLARVVRDPRGGVTTVAALAEDAGTLRRAVLAESAAGTRRHDRISRGQRFWLHVLPAIDGLVLFWFMTSVLNVDPRRPGILLLVAVVLALLGTIAVAAWTAAVGHALRRFKSDHGDLEWTALDGVVRGMLALTAVAVTLLGVLMYLRVYEEVFQATGVGGLIPAVVALVLAVAVVLVNVFVLQLTFADGSHRTTELDRLAGVVGPHLRRRERALRRAARLEARIEAASAATDRIAGRRP
ncbi:hypothetical protein WIS52_01270 [Pseudonocardia nematodicida]|uniref:Uncharacterized protein n=1 Tax=Pseudonocardia nematodicida TaxID=1206997 RepID=A0ABV1K3Q0_9PSEU